MQRSPAVVSTLKGSLSMTNVQKVPAEKPVQRNAENESPVPPKFPWSRAITTIVGRVVSTFQRCSKLAVRYKGDVIENYTEKRGPDGSIERHYQRKTARQLSIGAEE
jgi:hypothetical protein